MAYYIFLKSLRSLEEFRKNPHVKIPPKSPSTNFRSLGEFKNPIFNSEILFPYFRPGRPCGPLGLWPSQPTGLATPAGRNPPRPPHLARASVASSREYVFPFSSRLPSWPPLPRLSVKWAPAVSSIPHLQLPDLAHAGTASQPPSTAQLRASGAIEPLPPRLHFPSLNSPLKPSLVFNGVKAINAGVNPPPPYHPSPVLPRPL
jgi:hypothetical protein